MYRLFILGVIIFSGVIAVSQLGAAVSHEIGGGTVNPWQTETVDAADCFYPSLAIDNAGLPRISYGALGDLKFAWHNGQSWQLEVAEDQPGATGFYSALALDSVDKPHISYYSPYSSSLRIASYNRSLWLFQPVATIDDPGGRTSIAMDSTNMPHVAYWDSLNRAVQYARLAISGWQFDTIDTMTGTGQSVSLALALDSTGHPHLCYYDYDAGSLNYAVHNGLVWQISVVNDDVSYNGQGCAIAIDSSDLPHIGYHDLGMQYAWHNGHSWQDVTVDDAFFAGDGLSLVLDSGDHPHISYTNWASGGQYELWYAYAVGLNWWKEIVDTAPSGQRFLETSIAVDYSDRPHIGYWYQAGGSSALKYAVRESVPTFYLGYLPMILR